MDTVRKNFVLQESLPKSNIIKRKKFSKPTIYDRSKKSLTQYESGNSETFYSIDDLAKSWYE